MYSDLNTINNNLGNGVFKALTFSDFSASDDIKTVCQNMFSTLQASGICYRVKMKPTPNGTTADAYVYCASPSYGFIHIRDHNGTDYCGRVRNGDWSWDTYALKSDLKTTIIEKQFKDTIAVPSGTDYSLSKFKIPYTVPSGYNVLAICRAWVDDRSSNVKNAYLSGTGSERTTTVEVSNLNGVEKNAVAYVSILFIKS